MIRLSKTNGVFYGAQRNLRDQITCNLFLLCPNNSGSTFLSKAIGTSTDVWSLPREGQHALGFRGPVMQRGTALSWAARPNVLERLRDPTEFDWAQNEKAWYFQAQAHSADARVFFTKTPSFLTYPRMLQDHFDRARFLIMVRNPYAMIEAILRRKKNVIPDPGQLLELAIEHTIACLRMQRENQAAFDEVSTFFTYEEMCRAPQAVEHRIMTLVPEISSLKLNQRLLVKHDYNEPLRDMNADQIARLSAHQLRRISQGLAPHTALLAYFGYGLIG